MDPKTETMAANLINKTKSANEDKRGREKRTGYFFCVLIC